MDDEKWDRMQAACDAIGEERDFVVVPGIEYQDPDHIIHLPVFGRSSFYGRSPDIGDVARRARRDGAAAIFAHPRRRDAWQRFDPAWAADLAGIEVWNRKYDGIRPNAWALSVSAEHGMPATVALDWHGPRQLYPLALTVPTPAGDTNKARTAGVVDSMLAGDVRATAFGMDVADFNRGPLGAASRSAESLRLWSAPKIRALQRAVRRSG
ncbi:hypothetical protein [Microbacterium deminutum]